MPQRRILIAYTGGTIGMHRTERAWAPAAGYLGEQMRANPLFQGEDMPEYRVEEFSPLLDSANMQPAHWSSMACTVQRHIDEYDGFVILHGTDTMAYSASALAFMLAGLRKPVVFTGAQLPLVDPRSDGLRNVITSMLVAAYEDIPEVCLFFNQALYRGCRATKVDAASFAAFSSPNFPPLARAGISVDVSHQLVRRPSQQVRRLRVHGAMDSQVAVLWLFPGITGKIVSNFLQPPLKGVVMMAYGAGNGPAADPEFLAALAEARRRDIVIVACSQCRAGAVAIDDYATGQAMAAAGVISGYDMTPEAALTKLCLLFGCGLAPDRVRALVATDLRGELTRA